MPDFPAWAPVIAAFQFAAGPGSYDAAVEARHSGDFPAAIRLLEDIVAQDPGHADAWLQLGLALSASGDYASADRAFLRVLEIAPDYEDAWLGRARVALYEGRFEVARDYAERAGGAAELNDFMRRIDTIEAAAARPVWRIDVFAGVSDLSNGLDGWSEYGLALGRRLDQSTSVTIRADSASRFGLDDQYLAVRVDRYLSAGLTGYVEIGGSPDPVFRPELNIRAGVELQPLSSDWGGSVEAFSGSYLSGDVQSTTVSLFRDVADRRGRLGGRLIGLNDETGDGRLGYAVLAEWQASPPARLLLSFTDAPETSEGVTLDVRALSAGMRYAINDRRHINMTLVHEERSGYDRTAIVAGASWRF